MKTPKIKICTDCEHCEPTSEGDFFCVKMQKMVIVGFYPSEFHFCCREQKNEPKKPKIEKRVELTRKSVLQQFDMQGNLINTYQTATEASRVTGIPKCCISFCVNGRAKQAGGYKWRYTTIRV